MNPSAKPIDIQKSLLFASQVGTGKTCWETCLAALHFFRGIPLWYVEGFIQEPEYSASGNPRRPYLQHGWIENEQSIIDPFNGSRLRMIDGLLPFPRYFPITRFTLTEVESEIAKSIRSGTVSLPFTPLETMNPGDHQ